MIVDIHIYDCLVNRFGLIHLGEHVPEEGQDCFHDPKMR